MMTADRSKRQLLMHLCCGGLALGVGLPSLTASAAPGSKTTLTAAEALALLKEGNARFVTDSPLRVVQGRDRRLEIARGQTPIAVLVCCSDSRVPPELLFGRGLGELFIIRNAGNTIDNTAQGSVEYAVAELGVPLIVVMGHERCGAVDAAVAVVERNATFPGSIGQMIEPIVPAVLKARADLKARGGNEKESLLDTSVRENVIRVTHRLRTSEAMLLEPVRSGKLLVVGARYSLDDGTVEFFEG
jgi:carbonic anhydrase